jgi:hypothetical protein
MEASITLNPKEQKRPVVLNAVVAGQSTTAEAAASRPEASAALRLYESGVIEHPGVHMVIPLPRWM